MIPSDEIAESLEARDLPGRFRASGGEQGHRVNPACEMTLAPGESAIIPAQSGPPDLGLYVGDGDSKRLPRIAKVRAGLNWIVQPLQIWSKSAAVKERSGQPGTAYTWTKVDRKGNTVQLLALRSAAGSGGTALYPRIQLEVGTLNAAAERNASSALWGKVDKGLQCGIRPLKPKPYYRIGDMLEAEVLWRNTSDKPISSPIPGQLDLYPTVYDVEARSRTIDFGARFGLRPPWHSFLPGEVRSLGVVRIEIVAPDTPSPRSNAEPGHLEVEPGTYWLIGSGGVSAAGGGSPKSARFQFQISGREPDPDAALERKREAATARVRALGGEVRRHDDASVSLDLFETKATDSDLKAISCFDLVALTLAGTKITDAGLAHIRDMERLGDLGTTCRQNSSDSRRLSSQSTGSSSQLRDNPLALRRR